MSAVWKVWTAKLFEKVALDIKTRRIPRRKSKPWQTCVFVRMRNSFDLESALKLKDSVDRIVLAISDPQLAETVSRDHGGNANVFMVADCDHLESSFLKAIQADAFEGYDFVGVPPELDQSGDGISPECRQGFDNPASVETALLFGSQVVVDGVLTVFEANPKVGIVHSPYRDSLRQIHSALSITKTTMPRSEFHGAWYRAKALSTSLSSDADNTTNEYHKPSDRAEWFASLEDQLARSGFERSNKLFANPRDGEPATEAEFRVIRSLPSPKHKKVCLFVGFAANGEMRPHAYHFMRELRRAGYLVYALAANGAEDLRMQDPGADICDGLAARENIGYDFALWSAAMLNDRRLFDADELLWVNDSLIGPLVPLDDVMRRIESLTADIVGLVDSYQHKYHCQSFFLCMRRPAITSAVFEGFVREMRSYIDKTDVINKYELEFYSKMVAGGLSFDVAFRSDRLGFAKHKNATVQYWRELLKAGFPFIKAQIVRDNTMFDDLSDMKGLVDRYEEDGYGEAAFSGFGEIPDVAKQQNALTSTTLVRVG